MACEVDTTLAASCESGISCIRDPIVLLQIIAQLTCELADGGGGGGGLSGVECGVVDPEGVVSATSCRIYINTANQTVWVNSGTGTTGWHQYI